jgi:uncharacterized protein
LGKIIFLIAVVLIGYGLTRNYLRRKADEESKLADQAKPNSENMVRCTHCGVHLPLSEATLSQGDYFCSNDHLVKHSK